MSVIQADLMMLHLCDLDPFEVDNENESALALISVKNLDDRTKQYPPTKSLRNSKEKASSLRLITSSCPSFSSRSSRIGTVCTRADVYQHPCSVSSVVKGARAPRVCRAS